MSSNDDSSNDAVLSIYKTVPIMKCDGQCKSCGKTSYDCLSCYSPNMQPFHQNGLGKCVSKCNDDEYRLEYPSSQKGVLPSYSCESCAPSCKTCLSGSAGACTSCDTATAATAVFSEGRCESAD